MPLTTTCEADLRGTIPAATPHLRNLAGDGHKRLNAAHYTLAPPARNQIFHTTPPRKINFQPVNSHFNPANCHFHLADSHFRPAISHFRLANSYFHAANSHFRVDNSHFRRANSGFDAANPHFHAANSYFRRANSHFHSANSHSRSAGTYLQPANSHSCAVSRDFHRALPKDAPLAQKVLGMLRLGGKFGGQIEIVVCQRIEANARQLRVFQEDWQRRLTLA